MMESASFNATYLGPSEEPYIDAAYLEPNSLVNPNQNTPYPDETESDEVHDGGVPDFKQEHPSSHQHHPETSLHPNIQPQAMYQSRN